MVACCGERAKNTRFGRTRRRAMLRPFLVMPRLPTSWQGKFAASYRSRTRLDRFPRGALDGPATADPFQTTRLRMRRFGRKFPESGGRFPGFGRPIGKPHQCEQSECPHDENGDESRGADHAAYPSTVLPWNRKRLRALPAE